MNGNQLFYVGLKAFIEKDGAVLALKDSAIGLDFPGGKIKEEEWDLAEALKREVKEETGLDIEVGDLFTAWRVKFPPHPVYKINDVFLLSFRCKYVGGEFKISDEHTDYKWLTKEDYKQAWESNDHEASHFKALEKYFSTRQ